MGAEHLKLLNCENTGKNIAGSRVRRTSSFLCIPCDLCGLELLTAKIAKKSPSGKMPVRAGGLD